MTLESMNLRIDEACKKMGTVCITGDLNADLVVDGHVNVTGSINGNVIATGDIRCSKINGSTTIDVPYANLSVKPDIVVRNGNLMFEGSISNNNGHLYSDGPVFNDVDVVTRLNRDLDITFNEGTTFANLGMYFAVSKGCHLNAFSRCDTDGYCYGIINYDGCFVIEENAVVYAIGGCAGFNNISDGIVVVSGTINAFGNDQAVRNFADFVIKPNGRVYASGCTCGFYNFNGARLLVNGDGDSLIASGIDNGIYNIGGTISIAANSDVVSIGEFCNKPISNTKDSENDFSCDNALEVNGSLRIYNTYGNIFYNEYSTIYGTGCIYANGNIYHLKIKINEDSNNNENVGLE